MRMAKLARKGMIKVSNDAFIFNNYIYNYEKLMEGAQVISYSLMWLFILFIIKKRKTFVYECKVSIQPIKIQNI